MRADGIEPNVVTYSTLVNLAPDYDTANALVAQMIEEEISPNQKTTSSLFAKDLSAVPVDDLLSWYWSQGYKRGEPLQAAIASYRKVRRIDQALRIALHYPYLLASRRIMRHYSEQALEYFRSVLSESPEHRDADYALGVAHMELQQFDDAKPHLEKALTLATAEKRKEDIAARLRRIEEMKR